MTELGRGERVWSSITAHAGGIDAPVSLSVVCAAAVANLPVRGAAVAARSAMVASDVLCATDARGRELEELQFTVGEGPSLEVLSGGPSLLIGDLDSREYQSRWPLFASAAVEAGARAMLVLPLRIGAIRAGVLALHSDRPGRLTADELADAWMFAELALRVLLDAQLAAVAGDEYAHPAVDGLSDGRPEVHQATGMISVQLGVGIEEALVRLRARAFADGRVLSELAADVVARRLRFDPEDVL